MLKEAEKVKRYTSILIMLLLFVLTGLTACANATVTMVKSETIIEAGSKMLDASEFLNDTTYTAQYQTNVSALNLNTIGNIPIEISVNGETYQTVLKIVDTVAPVGIVSNKTVVVGEELPPEAFVSDVSDATEVKVYYKKKPSFSKTGEQSVTIVIEDSGKNKTELESKLYVLGILPTYSIEAGSNHNVLSANDFIDGNLDNNSISISFEEDVTKLDLNKPDAKYDLAIVANGIRFVSQLSVVDTTPPSATVTNKEVWIGETVRESDFIVTSNDISETKCYFSQQPDYNLVGEQEVHIVLEDIYQNKAQLVAKLTIMKDTEPPVITGAKDITVFVGDKLSYKKDVTAEDSKDGSTEVTVNSSAVNLYQTGTYQVSYSAVDSGGNKAVKTVNVNVIELDSKAIYATADDILAGLITADMSLTEKARKIHKWVKGSIHYTSSADKSDTLKGAYYGFKNRQGDCFTFYAVAEVLLTRAGVDNMRVTRVGGTSQHFWNLINVGTGWYHFDTCPTRISADTFMFTSVDAEDYTRRSTHIRNYYVYDKSLYPPVVGDVIDEPTNATQELTGGEESFVSDSINNSVNTDTNADTNTNTNTNVNTDTNSNIDTNTNTNTNIDTSTNADTNTIIIEDEEDAIIGDPEDISELEETEISGEQ